MKKVLIDNNGFPYTWVDTSTDDTVVYENMVDMPDDISNKICNEGIKHYYIDGEWSRGPIEGIIQEKLSVLATKRWTMEVGGCVLDGVLISTSRESQSMIASAYNTLKDNILAEIDFKSDSGWITIDLAMATGIAQTVATHVQQCFTTEKTHSQAISLLGTAEEVDAYDIETGWPTY